MSIRYSTILGLGKVLQERNQTNKNLRISILKTKRTTSIPRILSKLNKIVLMNLKTKNRGYLRKEDLFRILFKSMKKIKG